MNGVRSLFKMEDFNNRAVSIAAMNPSAYKLRRAAAWVASSGPRKGRSLMNAPITSRYTGSRAEQVIRGAIRIVASRSRLLSIVRVAMIAGTAQA